MKRVEVILSQALEEDFITFCEDRKVAKMYTKIPSVVGTGYANPKMGDSVWPQFNTMYIIYCKKEEAATIKEIAKILRKEYPEEGVACFVM